MCTLTFAGDALVLSAADASLDHRSHQRAGAGADTAQSGAANGATRVSDGGYQVWFNRDELKGRGPEIPPAEARTPGGVRYLAPTDTDAGGTWIAVNEFGVTIALLNGYVGSKGPPRQAYTSRGALVRSMADVRGVADIWARLTPALLAEFRPAVLCILVPGERPTVARWDGRDLEIDVHGDRQLPLTSSSHAQDEVQRFRRALYCELVVEKAAGGPAFPADLEAYHAFVGPDGPTAMTPCMERDDAATRSHCAIHVRPGEVQFTYVPDAPHRGVEGTTVTLRSPHVRIPSKSVSRGMRAPSANR